jgi:hypothetical protein
LVSFRGRAVLYYFSYRFAARAQVHKIADEFSDSQPFSGQFVFVYCGNSASKKCGILPIAYSNVGIVNRRNSCGILAQRMDFSL